MGGFPPFRSNALSGFGAPSAPSLGAPKPTAFKSRALSMLDEPEEPEEESFGSKLLDIGKAAVNFGSAGIGGLIGRQDLLSKTVDRFIPESLKEFIPDTSGAYERALKANLEGQDKPLSVAEQISLAPGGGRVLAETLAPGTPSTAAGRIAKDVGGLVGDIATDPLTYVTGGIGAAGKALKAGKVGTAAARALGSAPAGLVYAPEILGGIKESGGEALSKLREGDFSGAVEPGVNAALLSGLGALMATGTVKDAGDLMRRFGRATPSVPVPEVRPEPSRLSAALDEQATRPQPASLDDFLAQIRDEPMTLQEAAGAPEIIPDVVPPQPLPFVRPEAPVDAPGAVLDDGDRFVDVPAWTARYPDVLPDRTIGRTRVKSETPENFPIQEPGLLAPDGQRSLPTIHGPLIDDTQPFNRNADLEARHAELMAQNPEAAQAFVEAAEGAREAAERRISRKRPSVEPNIRPAEDFNPPGSPEGSPGGDPRLQDPNSLLGKVARAEEGFNVGRYVAELDLNQPRYAFRARDVGEAGIPAVSHAQASLSEADVRRVAPSRTESPQEVVRVDLSKLDPQDYEVIPRGEGEAPWVRFKREMSEDVVEPVGPVDRADIAAASKAEPPVVQAVASADTADLAQVSGLSMKQAEKGAADVIADGMREFSPEAVAIKRAVIAGEDLAPTGTEGMVRESTRATDADPPPAEKRDPIKHFMKYSSETMADRGASFRLTEGQRRSEGEFFWTHPDVPGVAFPSRKAALVAAERRAKEPARSDAIASTAPDPTARWNAGEKAAVPLVGRWNLANPHESLNAVAPRVAKATERLMPSLGRVVEAAARMAGESVNLKGLTLDSNIQAAVKGKDMRVGIMAAVESATRKYETRLAAGQYEGLTPQQRSLMFNREVARHIVNPVAHEIAHARADKLARTSKTVAEGLDKGGHGPAYVKALQDVYRKMSQGRDMLRRHIEQALDEGGGKLRDSLQQAWAEVEPVWRGLDAGRSGVPVGDGGTVSLGSRSGPSQAPSGPGRLSGGGDGPQSGVRLSARGGEPSGGLAPGSGVRGGSPVTETPEFKRWFGDSKVRDESGAPLRVYHGTNKQFASFDRAAGSSKTGNPNAVLGHFFTRDSGEASRYTQDWGKDGGAVIPAFLSVRNPYEMSFKEFDDLAMAEYRGLPDTTLDSSGRPDAASRERLAANRKAALDAATARREELIAEGYDGIVVNRRKPTEEWVAFHPEQIKSAIGNRGTFDPTNPDIRESARPVRPIPDKAPEAPKPTKGDKVLEAWRAGLVSAPGTLFVANPLGNLAEQIVRVGETATSAIVDRFMGGAKTRLRGEARAELAGAAKVAPSAVKTFLSDVVDAFKLAPEKANPDVIDRTPAIGGKTGRAVRIPFRILQAGDDLFKTIGGSAELHKLAWREAGGDKAKFDAIRKNPSEALLSRVAEAKKARTFQDPNRMAQSLVNLRNQHKWLNVVMPFVQTPANIASLALKRSPVGFYEAGQAYQKYRRAISAGADAKTLEALKGEAVDAIARPLLGTMVLGTFAAYAKSGGMTGSGPVDQKEKNLLKETGWQPYSFVIGEKGNQTYVPFSRFEPISSLLGFAADVAEAQNTKSAGDLFDKGMGSIVTNLTSKTYLQGLADAAELINDPKRFAGQYASNLAASAVPNVVKKATQAIDPVHRDTRPSDTGWAGIPERIGKAVAASIPGVSKTLPERRAVTGETVERAGNTLSRFLSPVQVTSDKPARDLEGLMVELGVSQGAPSRTVSIPKTGAKVQLTQAEYKFLQDVDKKATDFLRRQTNDPRFKRLPEDQQRAYIERVFRSAGDEGRKKLLSTSQFKDRARQAVREARA
jgi:hypothetical protein